MAHATSRSLFSSSLNLTLIGALTLLPACSGKSSTASTAPTPVISLSVGASPAGTALSAATVVTLTATVTGTSDSVSYSWDFGDNSARATGASVSHVFTDDSGSVRNFTVTLTATSGAAQATATKTIAVRALTGRWDGPDGRVFDLTQQGNVLTGRDTFTNGSSPHTVQRGAVGNPNTVAWERLDDQDPVTHGTKIQDYVSLTGDSQFITLTGSFNDSTGAVKQSVTLVRR